MNTIILGQRLPLRTILPVRALCIALTLLMGSAVEADEIRWLPIRIPGRCVPLADLYYAYPALTGKKTPSEIVAFLERTSTNVKTQPALTLYESEPYVSEAAEMGAEASERRKKVRKLFTKSNAILVTWNRAGNADGVMLYTEDLCKSLFGSLPQ